MHCSVAVGKDQQTKALKKKRAGQQKKHRKPDKQTPARKALHLKNTQLRKRGNASQRQDHRLRKTEAAFDQKGLQARAKERLRGFRQKADRKKEYSYSKGRDTQVHPIVRPKEKSRPVWSTTDVRETLAKTQTL